MATDFLNPDPDPDAYVITVDGEVLAEAGKNGVIQSFDVADQIRRALVSQDPTKAVCVFGFFRVRKGERDRGVSGI